MKTLALLIGSVVVLSGCLYPPNRTRPYSPERLGEISRVSDSPYTNYENVWTATLAVMKKNYTSVVADKERGTIKSHPIRGTSMFLSTKVQAFATIVEDDGLFIPEIKILNFFDSSEADSFSDGPTRRRWNQMIESPEEERNLEQDIRRILLPSASPPVRVPEPKKTAPAIPVVPDPVRPSKA